MEIPLVSLNFGNQIDSLSAIRAEENLAYCAISHVWADGLGNIKTPSLPICQLSQLDQSLERYTSKTQIHVREKT